MNNETWKPVLGYEGLYEVSDMGRVKSVPRPSTRGGILKPSVSKKCYLRVNLCKNGKQKTYNVHILVWEAFKGKVPDGNEIDHLDGNPKNNRLDNLDPKTHKENCNNPITVKRHTVAMQRRSENTEWRKNVSEGAMKRSKNQKWRENNAEAMRRTKAKPVDQFTIDGEYLKTWPSAREAARVLGYRQGNISACCRGIYKQAYGYIWRFA